MHDHRPTLSGRLQRWLDARIAPASETPVVPLTVFHLPVTDEGGVPGQGEPIGFAEAVAQEFQPFEWPQFWGPGWGTTWFRLEAQVPEAARSLPLEIVVDLSGMQADEFPGFQAEAMAYRPDGTIIKAVNPRNRWVPVTPDADGRVCVYLEAASNPPMMEGAFFEPTERGAKDTVGPRPQYMLTYAVVHAVNPVVRELTADLRTLAGLIPTLPETSPRRRLLEVGVDRALDLLDTTDVAGTAGAVREALAPLLASPAEPSAHRISAVGHAHIDTAWLWPIRETRRKIARTWANAMRLVDDGLPLVMVFPAAQHLAWLREDHPDLFDRVVAAAQRGQVVAVGGSWVEPDAVLPGGEAMVRQLVLGTRFFADALGQRCRGMWLPDSFGYSAALPQLARLAGMDWFLTQKISWNAVNDFPHHTFFWEGIDGSRIFTHFPPVDTYNAELAGKELAHSVSNFRDLGRANRSLVPFGYGDGGGGPTREMLWQAARVADLEGSPRVTIESPDAFFAAAREEYPDAPVWRGELYLELHRGTLTSQVGAKAGNRRNEALLHAAELFSTQAAVAGLLDYPHDELRACWEQVLVGQFHDILPGSSIAWAHRQNEEIHADVTARLEAIRDRALAALAGDGDTTFQVSSRPVGAGAMGVVEPVEAADATVAAEGAAHVLDNGILRVAVDERGLVTSLVDLPAGREVVPDGHALGLLRLHVDLPNAWDAWDLDEHHRHAARDLVEAESVTAEVVDGAALATVRRSFGGSTVTQTYRLAPGSDALEVVVDVDWHEQEKVLKLDLPVDVHADEARFETQFGHLVRPTHTNTSWDAARFEVSAHRWVHVGEPGYGVAIANAQTYGWSVERVDRPGRATASIVRATLVRGARYPDPRQDQGAHSFAFRVVPGADVARAVQAGYEATRPDVAVNGTPFEPLVRVDGEVVVEAVKLADDRSGDVVLRLYEPLGARATATLALACDVDDAWETDLLEEPLADDGRVEPSALVGRDGSRLGLALRPFQVATLRVRVRS